MKNKILVIGNSLSTMLRFRQKLFENLSNDYDLTLFTPIDNNDTLNSGFNVEENHLKNARKASPLNLVRFFLRFRKLIKDKFQYIFIYGVGMCFICGVYLRLLKRRNRRVIFFFTGLGAIFLRSRYRFLRYILMKFIITNVPHKIIVLNEDDKNYLTTLNKNLDLSKKIIVMRGEGVPEDLKIPLQTQSDKIKRIVFASRPVIDKGCSEFSVVIEMLRAIDINIPVTVYGFDRNDKGELNDFYFDNLETLNVQFKGRVDHLESHLLSSDLVVIISDREGANRVLLECLHMRLLFIASAVPGIENFVPEKLKEKLLADFKDPTSVVNKLIYILKNTPDDNNRLKNMMNSEVKYASTKEVINFYKTYLLN